MRVRSKTKINLRICVHMCFSRADIFRNQQLLKEYKDFWGNTKVRINTLLCISVSLLLFLCGIAFSISVFTLGLCDLLSFARSNPSSKTLSYRDNNGELLVLT